MIYIEKEGLPDSVNERIIEIKKSEKWRNISVDDTKSIRRVFDDEFPKDRVKSILLREQHGLCAYCMRRIRNDNHSRVEHLIPLSKDKERAIDYNNMIGVCDGGEKIPGQKNRILCCDAYKKETEIGLSPLNKNQMDKIAYKPDGTIYTEPVDQDMDRDINEVLLLNGIRKKDGSVRDTATEVLKGRRDAYGRARHMMENLNRDGKCTSGNVKKLIEKLCEKAEYEEYAGVKMYYFRKKYDSLVKRGL